MSGGKLKNNRCMFCLRNGMKFTTIEHVIPESLGNTKLTLKKGIVCDSCNHYLSRKVEAPFLNDPNIQKWRAMEKLGNKKGKVPQYYIYLDGHKLKARRSLQSGVAMTIDVPSNLYKKIEGNKMNPTVIVQTEFNDVDFIPKGGILSRFIGMIALETYVTHIQNAPVKLAGFISSDPFYNLREHVKVKPIDWEVSVRRIYPSDQYFFDKEKGEFQLKYESMFLTIESCNELFLFFIVVLYGIEFAICMNDSRIITYTEWLKENDDVSPLYNPNYSKNIFMKV